MSRQEQGAGYVYTGAGGRVCLDRSRGQGMSRQEQGAGCI